MCSSIYLQAQVGIGTSDPSPSARLQIDASSSTNAKGFLPPRVALQGTDDAQLTSPSTPRIVSPATGLLIFNTATAGTGVSAVTPGYYYYSGSAWVRLVTGTVSLEYGGTGQSSLAGVKSILGLTGENVAIGQNAGATGQGPETIAIGKSAALTNQGPESIAIGNSAASTNQGPVSIAIGKSAAQLSQGFQAIALGVEAGQNNQGANAVAIGTKAGNTSQAANSIAINASGVNLNPSNSGFYVDPIRNVSGSNILFYDVTSKEVTYGANEGVNTVGSIASSSNANGVSISGRTISLAPADGTNGGIVTNGTQTFAGSKTLSDNTASTSTTTGALVVSGGVGIAGNTNVGGALSGSNTASSTISGFAANINNQIGTTYQLVASDNGKIITLNNASAITLTVPAGLLVGFNCMVVQLGAGQVTIATSGGATVTNRSSFTKTGGQNAIMTLISVASNSFISSGDMSN